MANAPLYKNNVAGLLAATIGPSDTAILLGAGQGAAFPSPSAGDYFYATIVHSVTGLIEIVQCTARSVDTLTVVRGRDSTTAISFDAGSIVEMRITAQTLRELDWRNYRAVASGLASLDASTRLPAAQLPTTALTTNTAQDVTALKQFADGTLEVIRESSTINSKMKFTTDAGSLWLGIGTANTLVLADGDGDGTLPANQILEVSRDAFQYENNNVWHAGNFNPANYLTTAQRGAANGVASLDASTKIPVAQIPSLSYLPTAGGTVTGNLTVNGNHTVLGDTIVDTVVRSSDTSMIVATSAAGTVELRPNGSGSTSGRATLSSAGLFSAPDVQSTSDRRLKKRLRRFKPNEDLAGALKLYDWLWKDGGAPSAGPMAQDVHALLGGRYLRMRDDGYYTLDKAGLAIEMAAGTHARLLKLEKRVNACSKSSTSKRS